jgi:hypothetical protein
MFRAGRTFYTDSVDDPFYAVHHQQNGMYIPDYEATALGCVEQYRFCMDDKSFCTAWGFSTDIGTQLFEWVIEMERGQKIQALMIIYHLFTAVSSVKRYLNTRFGSQVLLTSLLRRYDEIWYLDQKNNGSWKLKHGLSLHF